MSPTARIATAFAVGFGVVAVMAWPEPSHGVSRLPWCGAWLSQHEFHRSIRKLWVARNWAHVGRPVAGPAPGVIGVQRHHVFKVIRVVGPGRVLAISGNDGNAVRTRVRSTSRVIAWRVL